jgi:hypothetical protein
MKMPQAEELGMVEKKRPGICGATTNPERRNIYMRAAKMTDRAGLRSHEADRHPNVYHMQMPRWLFLSIRASRYEFGRQGNITVFALTVSSSPAGTDGSTNGERFCDLPPKGTD